jgi:hemerythrin superfamily protein
MQRKFSVQKPSEATSATRRSKQQGADVTALLTEDHDKVKQLFKQYEKLKEVGSSDEKAVLAAEICLELTVHAQVEEEIFYPAVREATDDDDLMDEAEVEHASAKDLIAQIGEMDPEDDMFDARLKVLGEYVNHHVQEEEKEMFPKARNAKVDLKTLGDEVQARKEVLFAEMAGETAEEPSATPKAKGRSKQ